MADSPTGRCCICGNTYVAYGHNAEPLATGRCCDTCNTTKVVPARMQLFVDEHPHHTNTPNRKDS